MTPKRLIAAVLAAGLVAAPAAAADIDGRQLAGDRGGAFVGATFRLPLGGGERERAERPRLAIGLSHVQERSDMTGRIDRQVTPALELGLAEGRPLLLVAGQRPTGDADRRHGLAPGATLLGIAGIAAVVFVLRSSSWTRTIRTTSGCA